MRASRSENGKKTVTTPASKSILVTGAAGFVGSHLCERLVRDGHQVWGLDNFDDGRAPSHEPRNLQAVLGHASMHLVEGDLRDRVLLDGLLSDITFDAVVHLAARPASEPPSGEPEPTYDVNVDATLSLLEAMRRHGVPALVFVSCASVYGESAEAPLREEAPADRPLSPYAASKRAGEMLCHSYHHRHGLTVHCLRLFSVYGPRQRPDQGIHRTVREILRGPTDFPEDNGSTRRDYIYVDDVVEGLTLSLERARSRTDGDAEYHLINLASGDSVSERELIDTLRSAAELGSPPKERGDDGSDGTSDPMVALDRAEELLGYRPSVGLEEGLTRFLRWLRHEGEIRDGSRSDKEISRPGE